jgi:hypothetical protein
MQTAYHWDTKERKGTMMRNNRIAAGLILTGFAVLAPSVASQAALDSRTIPHPEWAQISGQVEQTSVVKADSGSDTLQATLRLSKGGHVMADFGAVGAGSYTPKAEDFIHVRGKAVQREGQVTILAEEVYAEGRVHSIHRDETETEPQATASPRGGDVPLSPAAPSPHR